ncbi:hypothetical protein LZ198_07215 [Myxococcus sp. K15C18031901]|uniref:hypothetical protein n=1 Tax=Myxococcus dinghuensis TaxID=2906761 RepID=UPI0020A751AB|nr:hypothetical protein [Myxococcus dinghuensis]MCP3098664.1 hypothetical protein [Myxococcus dinghuensis]
MAKREQALGEKQILGITLGGMVLAAVIPLTYLALTPRLAPPAEPGDIPSPTLAKVLNESIDKAVVDQSPEKWPGLIPEAEANSRLFLRELAQVVARCSKGRLEPNQKYNRMTYFLVRADGTRPEPITSRRGCGEDSLIFRLTFKDGRITEAFTDGRERQYAVDHVRTLVHVREFGDHLISADKQLHPERYFRAPPPRLFHGMSRRTGNEHHARSCPSRQNC